MKLGLIILLFLLPTFLLAAKAPNIPIEFEMISKDPIKKYDYGYIVSFDGKEATVKVWKHSKDNFLSKKMKPTEYRYFLRDWNERMFKSERSKYQYPEKLKAKFPIHAIIKEGKAEVKISFDKTMPLPTYVEKRILSWFKYLETSIYRRSSLKFRRL